VARTSAISVNIYVWWWCCMKCAWPQLRTADGQSPAPPLCGWLRISPQSFRRENSNGSRQATSEKSLTEFSAVSTQSTVRNSIRHRTLIHSEYYVWQTHVQYNGNKIRKNHDTALGRRLTHKNKIDERQRNIDWREQEQNSWRVVISELFMLCASHVIVVISSSDACDEALLWTRPLYQL